MLDLDQELVVEATKKQGRSKKIQVEVVKVRKTCGRPRKVVEAEISQFKEYSLPKKWGTSGRIMIPLTILIY